MNPGKFNQYLAVEKEWKAFHQEYVNKGKKRSWGLYEVRYPSGTDARCDYITVNTFDNYADTDDPYPDFQEVFKKVFPNTKLEDFMQRTDDSRRLTHSEFLALVDHTDSAIGFCPSLPREWWTTFRASPLNAGSSGSYCDCLRRKAVLQRTAASPPQLPTAGNFGPLAGHRAECPKMGSLSIH